MTSVFYKKELPSAAVINPEDSVQPVSGFPEVCISTFSKAIIDKFAAMDGVRIIAWLLTANGRIPVYEITYGGRRFAFYLSLVGAPACVCGLEEIIAMGGKRFVFFGCCGVLDAKRVGERLILPAGAVRDEGTSYHYYPGDIRLEPDAACSLILQSCMDRCGYPYTSGKIWTTDAIYRETAPQIAERKKEGCIAVDMEYSALLAVSRYRKVALAQFFYGADSLDGGVWEPRDLTDYGLSGADKYMALALECGLALSSAP